MIQLAILSPIPALRAGLRALLSGDAGLNVVAVAARLEDLADSPDPASVIVATAGGMDLTSEGLTAGQALLWVTDAPDAAPDAALVMALDGLELRAWGILPPDATAEMLQAAVHALAEGLAVAPPGVLRIASEDDPRAALLADARAPGPGDESIEPPTARENDVLQLLAQGLTNKQIAAALGISEHTVKFHVSAIYSKLGVANRAEAVRKAARQGWVPL